jgi:hypothetical protein
MRWPPSHPSSPDGIMVLEIVPPYISTGAVHQYRSVPAVYTVGLQSVEVQVTLRLTSQSLNVKCTYASIYIYIYTYIRT